jgi:type VII secretion-associated serine protease mycosin
VRRSLVVLAAVAFAWSGLASPAAADTGPTRTYVAILEQVDGDLAVRQFEASTQNLAARLEGLSSQGTVLALDVDRPVRALGSADPYRDRQWALDATSFENSWPTTNGSGAVVAVVDTGVQADHEDLAGTVLDGWDAIANRAGGTTDPHGHGTHVSGIIAAATGNGKGITGAAPGVRILPVRVLDTNGSGSTTNVLEGIIWAADHGADVINLSLGGSGGSSTYQSAIRYALSKGAVVVASAGNEAQKGNAPSYPAAYPEAIAVAATTASGARSSFSSYGSYIDIAAPGSAVYSTIPSGYASWSGTSMAAPYVSAAAALVAARYPQLSPLQIRDLLERSADDLGDPGRDDLFGAGFVDPVRALSLAGPLTPSVPAGPPATSTPIEAPPGSTPVLPSPAPPTASGYWVVGAGGQVQAFGSAPTLGDASGAPLRAPMVAAAATPTGRGYWLTTAGGDVFAFGDAVFYGSARQLHLNAPVVGMAPTASGHGYWLLGRDGGVFSFGDAPFYGSTGGVQLNQPVVDMAPTPSGRGYWFVGADGGVFSFGDATFYGSAGGIRLNQPVVSLAPSARGGYWLVAADGGIFAFNAPFHGSLPGLAQARLSQGRRIRATGAGAGYYVLGSDGEVYPFGAAAPHGSAGNLSAVDLILAP